MPRLSASSAAPRVTPPYQVRLDHTFVIKDCSDCSAVTLQGLRAQALEARVSFERCPVFDLLQKRSAYQAVWASVGRVACGCRRAAS